MAELWLQLFPIAFAMAITPARYLAVMLLLHTPKAALSAFGLVAGMASTMLIQGAAFALIFSLSGVFDDPTAEGPPLIVDALFLVIGILMLVFGGRMIFQEKDEDKAPPAWLDEIESFGPGSAYKLGLGWLFVSPKQWIFTLTAVAVIYSAGLTTAASFLNYILFILLVLSPFLLLLVIYILFRARADMVLDKLFVWIEANSRVVMIAASVFFGLFFLVKSLQGFFA